MKEKSNNSYSRIVTSSALIGGAQGINILIGMIRVKCVALLIGPMGVGLVGTYQAILQLIGNITGLGLQSSAVRDVAEAVASNDNELIGKTVLTLRRMCWITGSIGSLLVALFSNKLSQVTFGSSDYSIEIALVGLTLFFSKVQGGQMALIQGMRRIGDLAKLNIFGALSGSVVSVGLYAIFGTDGIVPALVLLSTIQLVASWWFARKIDIPKVSMNWIDSFRMAGGMIKLGLAFMWSGTLLAGVAYATRTLIGQEIDLVAVGIFTAAFNLSGMMVNFILSAMGADYYPSLTAISSDHGKMRELVNQQTEVGLLLAMPALLGTLALSPWVIKIFYSSDFYMATFLLQWFSLGCLGRIISWPMGFIILAKGASRLFAATETIANVLHLGLIWALLIWCGIEGVSIAFFALYIIYTVLMLAIARHLIGFSWSRGVRKLLGIMLPIVIATFIICRVFPVHFSALIGFVTTSVVTIYCLRELNERLGPNHKICRLTKNVPVINWLIPEKKETN